MTMNMLPGSMTTRQRILNKRKPVNQSVLSADNPRDMCASEDSAVDDNRFKSKNRCAALQWLCIQ